MERTIVDYHVTQTMDRRDLDTQVKNYIAKGWCPFGGVSFMAYTYTKSTGPVLDERWQQALVKYGPAVPAASAEAASQMNASQAGSGRKTRRRR